MAAQIDAASPYAITRHEVVQQRRRDASTFEHEILAIHLRRPGDAAAFLSAFPKLGLAGGTTSRAYTSPLFSRGRGG